MIVWQRLNAPRNKREKRVAKIARDIERERIIALLEEHRKELAAQGGYTEAFTMGFAIALIKGENK